MPETVALTLPAMGESVTDGTVARWLKARGDAVAEGETVVEVTTDKVDIEVPAPVAGTVDEVVVAEGDTVPVGAVLARIMPVAGGGDGRGRASAAAPQARPAGETAGEAEAAPPEMPSAPARAAPATRASTAASSTAASSTAASSTAASSTAASSTAKAAASAVTPAPRRAREPHDPSGSAAEPPAASPQATPLARRRAALTGTELSGVRGSGPDGLIRRGDVPAEPGEAPREPAPASPGTRVLPTASPAAGRGTVPRAVSPEAAPEEEGSVTPLRGPQAKLVTAMEGSRDIPTATSMRTMPASLLDQRRRQLTAALEAAGRGRVSYTHLIAFAVARAAGEMPGMRVRFERDAEARPLLVQGGTHLGLAVDTRRPDGSRFLVVPVLRHAAGRDFAAFRAEYERLVELARTGGLSPDELTGATLTLTNPGGIGTMASVPRLLPGQGCIIAAGAIGYPPEHRGQDEARLRELGVGRVVTLTSTYDHRVIQGAASGELLARIEALLNGADGFYEAVFTSLGLGAPADVSVPVRPARPASPDAGAVLPAGVPAVPPASLPAPGQPSGAAPVEPPLPSYSGLDRALLAALPGAASLVRAYRTHGHLGAHLDPLGTSPPGDPSLDPEYHALSLDVMARIPAKLLRVYVPGATLAEVLPNLRRTYCGTIAYEIEHLSSHEQRRWLREQIESGSHRPPLSDQEKLRLLWRLTKVDAMERYLRRTFLGQKTFSGEGVDMLVPMLERLLGLIAEDGTTQVVMGMAHRGRLAVIAHVVNRPYEDLLRAFEKGELPVDDPTGDVKYHVGSTGTYVTTKEKHINVQLLSNPSHLEAVDGVVEGWTRVLQSERAGASLRLDPDAAVPILIHGDAAFSGEGVVQEVFNLQSLPGYTTGGTVHVIVDNQLGFTTDPVDARSTRYSSDLAKGFDVPIIHVNTDDAEACMAAARLAHDYRRAFHRDVVIHLVGYRRFGHNETDEPSYTQPLMYQRIREHPTARELLVRRLGSEGLIGEEEAQRQSDEVFARITDAHHRVKQHLTTPTDAEMAMTSAAFSAGGPAPVTAVDAERLRAVNEGLFRVPDGFRIHPKLVRQLERRKAALEQGGIDWGHAEGLALGSLLLEGVPVRLTGQDSERGTFSHRQMVLHDAETGVTWAPIQHLEGAQATIEVHNSPLSEVGALGFEYGYSAADPRTLVIWEAQFGDFANNAQMVIDQFMVSARAKWGQRSRLTLLLPHGYEGQGPEHSSARIERFLSLCADGNIRVAVCSTSDQYFHLLRDQALAADPRPLVVFTPKSLLRAPEPSCTLERLALGAFREVIDDPEMSRHPREVRVLLLCTGKVYWELQGHELRREASDLAIARLELLDPLPLDAVLDVVRGYPNLERMYWVQEEPENMGAWNHLQRRVGRRRPYEVGWEYIGRPRRAAPSEGYHGSHAIEQERVLREALLTSYAAQEAVYRSGAPSAGPSPSNGGAPEPAPAGGAARAAARRVPTPPPPAPVEDRPQPGSRSRARSR